MLFNSLEFLFVFLPITFIVYFVLNKKKLTQLAKGWLVLASLYFYSFWKLDYLPIILTSMIFNYSIGATLVQKVKLNINRKAVLLFGIVRYKKRAKKVLYKSLCGKNGEENE